MRTLLFGNSGSGKSLHARRLAAERGIAHLDSIVREPGQVAVQRRAVDVDADLRTFMGRHADWVIAGCCGELIEAAALLDRVRGCYLRDDAWSYCRHRRVFDDFAGNKRELTATVPV